MTATKPQLAIWAGNAAPFDPLSLQEGHVGGSEEAVIHLSAALAKYADVTVFAPKPERLAPNGTDVWVWKNVQWRPPEEFNLLDGWNAVLVWRSPQIAAQLAGEVFKVAKANVADGKPDARVPAIWNWLHDTHYGATPEQYEKANGTIVLSQAHNRALNDTDLLISQRFAKRYSAMNGVDVASLPAVNAESEQARDPHKVIYASSPDRGLLPLLEMWPDVKAAVPDATLDIYYDWTSYRRRIQRDSGFANSQSPCGPSNATLLNLLDKAMAGEIWIGGHTPGIIEFSRPMELKGVTFHGGVSHAELHKAYLKASVVAYPVGSFIETSCISMMKAQCLGCYPIVYGHGALFETVKWGSVVAHGQRDLFLEELISILTAPSMAESRIKMAAEARKLFDWSVAAKRFNEILFGSEAD